MSYYWNSWGPIMTAKEHGVITKEGPVFERMYAGYDDRYHISDDELERLETLHPIVRDFLKHMARGGDIDWHKEVMKNPKRLLDVPADKLTAKICLAAVWEMPELACHVPEHLKQEILSRYPGITKEGK